MLTVALIGRPNVGKSTLFNRLTGKRHALVDDQPGVTRDWREGEGHLSDLRFRVLDTAGLEDADPESFRGRIQQQTKKAVEMADVLLMMIDGRSGLMPDDNYFAQWLRKVNKPVILLSNKCEATNAAFAASEAWELGLGEPVPISAEHGEGLSDLYDRLRPLVDAHQDQSGGLEDAVDAKKLQVAILGRPNAGKSTLMNALLGEERVLVGPEAGITRDAIAVPWNYKGTPLTLVDTAGLRRKSNITDKVESLATHDALRVVKYAQVVILLVDATQPLEKQDVTLARHVTDEGRALIVAVNKWDLVKDKKDVLEEIEYRISHSMAQVRGVPLVTISALNRQGLDELMQAVFHIYALWNKRFPTSQLNRFLQQALEIHPPPLSSDGRRIKLRYMTQAKTRPPGFVVFCNKPESLPESYEKYLTGAIREAFDMPGVPIRIMLRKRDNPFDRRKRP